MKYLFILFSLFLASDLLGQDTYDKYVSKFYSRIDSTRKLQCCDSNYHGFSLSYDIPLLELPYEKLDLEDYEKRNLDDSYLESYVEYLVESYYKLKPSIRDKVTKSCYSLKIDYKIEKDLTYDGLYWVEGTLKIRFSFQSEDKNFCLPWYERLFKL